MFYAFSDSDESYTQIEHRYIPSSYSIHLMYLFETPTHCSFSSALRYLMTHTIFLTLDVMIMSVNPKPPNSLGSVQISLLMLC